LEIREPGLDHVADRDEPDHLAAFDHRDMAEAPCRHEFENTVGRIAPDAGYDAGGHQGLDPVAKTIGAAPPHFAHDIALGDDARHRAPVGRDHDRPDPPRRQKRRRLRHRGRRRQGDNSIVRLRFQDMTDKHGILPPVLERLRLSQLYVNN
jgi:hypothetical protein